MSHTASLSVAALVATLVMVSGTQAFDEARYPDWKGQWMRAPNRAPARSTGQFFAGPPWDPGKPQGRGQEAPLTDEYRAIFEANLADQAAGGQGTWPSANCLTHGMPAAMTVYFPMEIVVLPETTYIIV